MPRKKAAAVNAAEVAETPAPKKRGRKPGSKNKTTKEKGVASKKQVRKAASAPVPQIIFQIGGFEYNGTELMEKAKAEYRKAHPRGRIGVCNVYIKPEENAAYYVINKVEGKVPIE